MLLQQKPRPLSTLLSASAMITSLSSGVFRYQPAVRGVRGPSPPGVSAGGKKAAAARSCQASAEAPQFEIDCAPQCRPAHPRRGPPAALGTAELERSTGDAGFAVTKVSRTEHAAVGSPSLRHAAASSRFRLYVAGGERARISLARRAAAAGSESSPSRARMSSKSAEAVTVNGANSRTGTALRTDSVCTRATFKYARTLATGAPLARKPRGRMRRVDRVRPALISKRSRSGESTFALLCKRCRAVRAGRCESRRVTNIVAVRKRTASEGRIQ